MKKINDLIASCENVKAGFVVIDENIKQLQNQKDHVLENGVPVTYSKAELIQNLLAFYTGWMTVVSAYNYRSLEDRTRKAFVATISGMELIIPGFNTENQIINLNKAS